MTAADHVARALALIPGLEDHAQIPGSALPDPSHDAAWALLERAVTLDPSCARAHAARGNLLVRRGSTIAARRSYALAARLDPYDAPARVALGELAFMAGDEREAETWFDAAFALTRQYARAPRPGTRSALVLATAGPWHRNIPLDFVVDPARWALQRWYLPDAAAERPEFRLPAYDLVIDAIGASDAGGPALAAAERFAGTQRNAVINDPRRVAGTARAALSATLRGVGNCRATESRRVTRAELLRSAIDVPLIVRPADAHGGQDLERIDDAAALARYAANVSAAAYDAAPFVEYRSADAFYRKYRVMFVDGEPYPYHLAIDARWMIHYHRAPMAQHPWMRAEERRFLAAPEQALPGWDTTLREIAAAIGLDYGGIDCALLPDGTLFVFEADAAMLVHNFDPDPAKRAAYERIRAALDALLARRAA
jgi:tetratricopeptide (TPR) repeat protein